MAHTLGADGVFANFARAARLRGDGSLLEWRNAAACARGRSRPDGYGLLQVERREHGFFLEFDRGTVHPAALRAKFAAYQRYESGVWAPRDYETFPAILVVTAGPGSEQRVVDAVRAANAWQASPLAVLATTVGVDRQRFPGTIRFDLARPQTWNTAELAGGRSGQLVADRSWTTRRLTRCQV
jgi:hypothetical protein